MRWAIPTQVLANQLVHHLVKAVFCLVFVGIKRMQLLDELQPPSSHSNVGLAFPILWKPHVIDQPDRASLGELDASKCRSAHPRSEKLPSHALNSLNSCDANDANAVEPGRI